MTTRKSLSCSARLKEIAASLRAEVADGWSLSYVNDYRDECFEKAGRIILEGAAESQLPSDAGDAVRQAKLITDHMHEHVRPRAVFVQLSASLSPIENETITCHLKTYNYSPADIAHQASKYRREVLDEAADRLDEVAEWVESLSPAANGKTGADANLGTEEALPLEPDDWLVLRASLELGADRHFVTSYQVMRKVDPEAAEMPRNQRERLRDAGLIKPKKGRGFMLTSTGAEAAKS